MKKIQFIRSSLRYYWKRYVFLALGIAVSAAVLTGALIVGDSVAFSLNRIAEKRLGNVQWSITAGDRYFSSLLGERLKNETGGAVATVLRTDGSLVISGGQGRINSVRIYGVDSLFNDLAKSSEIFSSLKEDEAVVGAYLAGIMGLKEGDEFLLRMTRTSLIPLNAPFISDADNIVSVRLRVTGIAGEDQLGVFNLQNTQTAPYNIFVNKKWMQDLMEIGDKVSLILLGTDNLKENELIASLRRNMSLADAGLSLHKLPGKNILEMKSDRVFIDNSISEALQTADIQGDPVLTYFVNSFVHGDSKTPYSFITGVKDSTLAENEIILNRWLAADLSAEIGDSIGIEYFKVGPLRELSVVRAGFVVAGIIEMDDPALDRELMPDIPGMSNAGNCRDWEAGVPVDLESIRDKDEAYWTRYKGTPKALVSVDTALKLWANRFGTFTSYRFQGEEASREQLAGAILETIDPEALGFKVNPVRDQSRYAAENGYDFTQLFGGLSFFLLLAAVLLSALLFLLNIEGRKDQLHTLSAMGLPGRTIRSLLLIEGMLVAIPGSLLGLLLALLYNRLVFSALNGIWMDIVRTDMLEVRFELSTFIIGFVASLVLAGISLYLALNKYLKSYKRKASGIRSVASGNFRIVRIATILLVLLPVALVVKQLLLSEVYNPSVFFLSGGLLLLGGLVGSYLYFSRDTAKNKLISGPGGLAYRNSMQNRSRSLAIVFLLSIGTFLVISTGSNRKDLFTNAEKYSAGTGGFMYYAESSVPVLNNLNDAEVRYSLGLDGDYGILQFRKADGDDASCLNLNRITNPAILGVYPEKLAGRFSFVSSTPQLDQENPWLSLDDDLEEGIIPAIADETVIKWGLGMAVGDTLHYRNAEGEEFSVLLIGGLAPSIFQGSILISNTNYLEQFPSSSGTSVFLVDGNHADTALIEDELNAAMRDYGWSMTYTGERLAEFSSVTNTYLSIFLIMGALGLLVGTIGLAVILYRSVLERRREIALMKALGFSYKQIKTIIGREYSVLLLVGSITGILTSLISTLPSFLGQSGISVGFILFLIGIILVNGFIWIWLITIVALKQHNLNNALRTE